MSLGGSLRCIIDLRPMAVVRPGAPVLGLYERQFVEFGYLEIPTNLATNLRAQNKTNAATSEQSHARLNGYAGAIRGLHQLPTGYSRRLLSDGQVRCRQCYAAHRRPEPQETDSKESS
jgi:hypothetical protein